MYERGDRRQLRPDQVDEIERILARRDEADQVGHMDLSGFKLHPLNRDLAGFWAVTIGANWCVTFRFDAGHAHDLDLVDCH